MDLSITENLLGKNVSRYISTTCTHVFRFFFRKYSYTLAFEFDRKHYFSVYFYLMCFNSVLIPPVNRGPRIFFFKFELHQNGIFFASFEVQFAEINYSFETEF